jgi:hypothetical protein
MSTTWDVIPYQHLSHDSWPLCFLTPHLVPINIYLCSLVIFWGVLTNKVTESCSFKSRFMQGLTMKTAMLRLGFLPLADGLSLSLCIDAKDSWTDSDLTITYLSWFPSNISLSDLPGTFPLALISSPSLCMAMGSSSLAGVSLYRAPP